MSNMNWYQGNIAEAVAESKTKNAIFVVYIEGKDEVTQKLTQFINAERIRNKLESDDFVAIKIESDSQAYMQFATIYQVVPVPSIFFIGKSGTPLDIGTGIIASVDELEQKIDKVLAASGKSTPSVSASSSFIAGEQAAAATSAPQPDEIVCEDGVCFKKPSPAVEAKAPAAATEDDGVSARLEETRKLLEEKRRERIELESKVEKERELRRRQEGKGTQQVQSWQREQELKDLKDSIRREKLEEQAARDRIRAQIAGDRAERAQKTAKQAETAAANASNTTATHAAPQPSRNTDTTRLQFRFATGDNKTQSFNCQQTLSVVRAYVRNELLPGTGISGDFMLATTYPKREFTAENDAQTLVELGLFPSAVILVIGKQSVSPSAIIARSGGIINIVSMLFWTLVSPFLAVFGYIKNIGGGRRDAAADAAKAGAAKRASEEQSTQQDAAKRRNLDRFVTGPSTSKDAADAEAPFAANSEQKPYRRYGGASNVHRLTDHKDSDDENATWNGNSTQQQ